MGKAQREKNLACAPKRNTTIKTKISAVPKKENICDERDQRTQVTVNGSSRHLSSVRQSIRFVIGSALVQIQEVAPFLYILKK